MSVATLTLDIAERKPENQMPANTECACWNCIETELYSRLYCQDCYDYACGKTDEDMH